MKSGEYILVRAPDNYPGKKYRNKYIYEHHLVWWINTGDIIGADQVIHHKNENKLDNRFENLEVLSRSSHSIHHSTKESSKLELVCPVCNRIFIRRKSDFFFRRRNKQLKFYCSRRCSATDISKDKTIAKLAWTTLKCCECSKDFLIRNSEFRRRTKQKGSPNLSCSKNCGYISRNKR